MGLQTGNTACSNLYRRTRDIRLTQRFARHSSILSTAIYTHSTDEELVRSVQELPC
jgi:site-specific recombinase XerD